MRHPGLVPTVLLACVASSVSVSRATEFEVRYTPKVRPGPVSARVYVMLGPAGKPLTGKARPDPRIGPDWFRPQPIFAVEAKGWAPGEPLRVGDDAVGFPAAPSALEPGEYVAQAVVRLNPDTHKLGDGEGNAFGPVVPVTVGPGARDAGPVRLTVDTVVPPRKFEETDRIKLVEIDSPTLSAFHHRPIKLRAGVILPEGDPSSRRGTLYIIPGFGGDHHSAGQFVKDRRLGFGKDLIRVVLDPDCGTGHHVFADSAFNGPRGRSLVSELIPHIETTFRAIPEPRARLLNGHSSGGWSSLWLQVTYPDTFGGVWSTSPDPVDFRDFSGINLYARGENFFRDPAGNRRPIARRGRRPVLFVDRFSKLEDVVGDGGQFHSFEAVFSPLDADGRPRPLYDRATGAIDLETARAWQAYDIRLVMQRNWEALRPGLKGKVRVVVGDLDTFYLEGAVKRLKSSLDALGSDAAVEIVPDRDHRTVIDPALAGRFDREMNAALEKSHSPRGDDSIPPLPKE